MKIRPFAPGDIQGLLQIQEDAALGGGWRGPDYQRTAGGPGGLILVAPDEQEIIGFIAASRVFDQAEVLNMAVMAGRRRQGIGRQLLVEACRQLFDAGARSVWLEVRVSNLPAIRLYESLGFAACKTRKDYYSNPTEDACVVNLVFQGGLQVGIAADTGQNCSA